MQRYIEEIRQLCNKTIYKYHDEPSSAIHRKMQSTLSYWANSNGYTFQNEYVVDSRGDDSDRNGRIDFRVVIEGKVFLIEFDTTNKMKSVYKLLNNPADYRLWVRAINRSLIFFYYFQDIDIKDIKIVPVENWDKDSK